MVAEQVDTATEAAFTAFYRQWFPRMVSHAASHLHGDEALGEDIAQEAFTRAWCHWPALDSLHPSERRRWLFTVTNNLCHDRQRRQARYPHQPFDPIHHEPLLLDFASPERVAIANEAAMRLYGWLERLPAHDRRTLIRYEWAGVDDGQPRRDTLKNRVFRARCRLRLIAGQSAILHPAHLQLTSVHGVDGRRLTAHRVAILRAWASGLSRAAIAIRIITSGQPRHRGYAVTETLRMIGIDWRAPDSRAATARYLATQGVPL